MMHGQKNIKLPVFFFYYHVSVSKYLCGAAVFQMGTFSLPCIWMSAYGALVKRQ
jgi:hypothetical protein